MLIKSAPFTWPNNSSQQLAVLPNIQMILLCVTVPKICWGKLLGKIGYRDTSSEIPKYCYAQMALFNFEYQNLEFWWILKIKCCSNADVLMFKMFFFFVFYQDNKCYVLHNCLDTEEKSELVWTKQITSVWTKVLCMFLRKNSLIEDNQWQ